MTKIDYLNKLDTQTCFGLCYLVGRYRLLSCWLFTAKLSTTFSKNSWKSLNLDLCTKINTRHSLNVIKSNFFEIINIIFHLYGISFIFSSARWFFNHQWTLLTWKIYFWSMIKSVIIHMITKKIRAFLISH